jgi:glyoxylase-like metal-dependent hydrolase (beta-lactamase superfamily II)
VTRHLWSVLGNSQKLDGGAMFGNAPKAMWSKWAPADDDNRIDLACRCLVVRDGARVILCEAGIGAFFGPEMRARFGVQEEHHVLLAQLGAIGIAPEQVDVIVLSHLHFDHAGGVFAAHRQGQPLALAFPRAHYVVGRVAFQRAQRPHPRDRASFVPELPGLIERTGRLELLDGERSTVLGDGWRFHQSNGHTPGMLLAELAGARGPLLFCADLVPGMAWVRRAITMGYDRYPELLIDEKTALLGDLLQRGGRLFFTHDPQVAVCGLARDDRGNIVGVDALLGLAGDAA